MVPLLGRELVAARLRAAATGAGALVLAGDPGMGKTELLADALAVARAAGRTVLAGCGVPAERDLPYATVHQLVRPLLGDLGVLAPRQRSAVAAAFGLDDGTGVPDRLQLGIGLLTLMSESAGRRPLLVVVDDLHWADRESVDLLGLVARRLIDAEPVAMLLATRRPVPLDAVPVVELEPLDEDAAGALLDAQPVALGQAERRVVLDLAAGNPLALVELARHGVPVEAGAPDPSRAPTVTDRLLRSFGARCAGLPPATADALLLAAAGDDRDGAELLARHGPEPWQPAQAVGLVELGPAGVRFRHPLVRTAVYAEASADRRRQAHLRLADLLARDPDRRAWHLAAASTGPDDEVAALLDASAERARRRGGWAAAAAALERSAALSTTGVADRAVRAARAAMLGGDAAAVLRLADRAREAGADRVLQDEADLLAGWALSTGPRHADAVARLLAVARRHTPDEPVDALEALSSATVAAYYAGDPALTGQIEASLAPLDASRSPSAAAWVLAGTDPGGHREQASALLPTAPDLGSWSPIELNHLAGAAWALDASALAGRVLDELTRRLADGPDRGENALVEGTHGAVLADLGRWPAAQEVCRHAHRVAAASAMPVVAGAALLTVAHLAALTGALDEAAALVAEAVSDIDLRASRALAARQRLVLGEAELAAGDGEAALDRLVGLVLADGSLVHPHAAFGALVPAAQAASRTRRLEEGRAVLMAFESAAGPDPGPRVRALLEHARALLAPADSDDDDGPQAHFAAALADPAGATWPYERARLRLDHGAWLRRRRRVSEARTELAAALDVLDRMGARPSAERARAELRAAGVPVSGGAGDDPLARLTPQQREIVLLAARGWTNRQIGERLFLSPRTVGSHLYRVFPELQVASRAQLRDVVEGAQTTVEGAVS